MLVFISWLGTRSTPFLIGAAAYEIPARHRLGNPGIEQWLAADAAMASFHLFPATRLAWVCAAPPRPRSAFSSGLDYGSSQSDPDSPCRSHCGRPIFSLAAQPNACGPNRASSADSALHHLRDLWWMADHGSYGIVLVLVRNGLDWTDIPRLHRSSSHDCLGRSFVSSTPALAIPSWFIHRQRHLSVLSCGDGPRENLVFGSLKLNGQFERNAEQSVAA